MCGYFSKLPPFLAESCTDCIVESKAVRAYDPVRRRTALQRFGAAQDLAELDIDLAEISQASGWKSIRMSQYSENINALGREWRGRRQ